MLRWYQAKLAQRPFVTQCITTAVLFATGDVIAQQAVEQRGLSDHDLARTGRMGAYGGFIFGPLAGTWFKFLDRSVRIPSSPNLEIVGRVACDQLIFAPINMGLFLTTMSVMEGSDPKKKLEDNYWTGLTSNWKVWPAVQLVNFKMVPLDHRLLVVNVISLGWNSYLSYLNQQGPAEPVEAVKETVKDAVKGE